MGRLGFCKQNELEDYRESFTAGNTCGAGIWEIGYTYCKESQLMSVYCFGDAACENIPFDEPWVKRNLGSLKAVLELNGFNIGLSLCFVEET